MPLVRQHLRFAVCPFSVTTLKLSSCIGNRATLLTSRVLLRTILPSHCWPNCSNFTIKVATFCMNFYRKRYAQVHFLCTFKFNKFLTFISFISQICRWKLVPCRNYFRKSGWCQCSIFGLWKLRGYSKKSGQTSWISILQHSCPGSQSFLATQ